MKTLVIALALAVLGAAAPGHIDASSAVDFEQVKNLGACHIGTYDDTTERWTIGGVRFYGQDDQKGLSKTVCVTVAEYVCSVLGSQNRRCYEWSDIVSFTQGLRFNVESLRIAVASDCQIAVSQARLGPHFTRRSTNQDGGRLWDGTFKRRDKDIPEFADDRHDRFRVHARCGGAMARKKTKLARAAEAAETTYRFLDRSPGRTTVGGNVWNLVTQGLGSCQIEIVLKRPHGPRHVGSWRTRRTRAMGARELYLSSSFDSSSTPRTRIIIVRTNGRCGYDLWAK